MLEKHSEGFSKRIAALPATTTNAGRATTEALRRRVRAQLFLVPGMNHCGGGPATDSFDGLGAIVDWVERGSAPARIDASARPGTTYFPGRTRPLCAYPSYARYEGSGSLEDGRTSFVRLARTHGDESATREAVVHGSAQPNHLERNASIALRSSPCGS